MYRPHPSLAGDGATDALRDRVTELEAAVAAQALVVSGLGTAATRNLTVSTDDPTGGRDGDVWVKVG